jgi:hypothetical protein
MSSFEALPGPPAAIGDAALPIAAIVHDGSKGLVDALMVEIVRCLRAQNWRLAGLVQHNRRTPEGYEAMEAEELASGRSVRISLPRGAGARACRLDPAGLAEAAALAAAAFGPQSELVVFNKFARQEADGHGLRAEMGLAVAQGLPMLTSVQTSLLAEWSAFAGEAWRELPPEVEAVLDWCRALRRPA